MHGAASRPLDGTMAIRIAQFLVHLNSDKRPGFAQLKADYKAALDTVCKFIDHPSLSAKHGMSLPRVALRLALGFEVNAGACDSYLREYIDPLKFLTCVKGNLVLTATPLNSDGLDIEGISLSFQLADLRFVLYARQYSFESIPCSCEEQS